MKKLFLVMTVTSVLNICIAQNIGINATGALPDSTAMLDISSTTSGVLMPRMTTTQRNAITSPPNGLELYNTTTNTFDINRMNHWESVSFTSPYNTLVYVYSMADLPTPSGSSIKLDSTKTYVFSGFVNISPNYINLNGAGIRGTDPSKDAIISSVAGGVLRSTNLGVYIQSLTVLPLSGSTKAYDFSDATGTQFCTFISGASVAEYGVATLGVGQISGFKTITFINTFWNCADGLKVTGNVGRFASSLNYITGMTTGAGIEFLAGLTIQDIDISNNYFIYTGQIGVKVNAGSSINRGRMTTNMFSGVGTLLSGFNSYTPAWEMRQNTDIPNTRAFGSLYFNNNSTATSLTTTSTFYKIAGTTTANVTQRFTAGNNRLTYTGKEPMTAKITAIIGALAPADAVDYSIAIAKNGVVIANPNASLAPGTYYQSFALTLVTEVDISTNDYLEVFIRKNNTNSTSLKVDELQFRVSD